MPRTTGVERVRPWTDQQRAEIHSVMLREFGELSFLDAENITGHEGEFGRDVAALRRKWSAANQALELERLVEQRTKFCRSFYGLDPDFSQVVLPPMRPGFGWTSLIPMGLTAEHVYSVCSGLFPCRKFTQENLDSLLMWYWEERDARKGSYAVRLRNQVEADPQLVNLSIKGINTRKLTTITLVERLDLELAYWVRKRKHLDVSHITWCSGSRFFDYSCAPAVHWDHTGSLRILCRSLRVRGPLRSREVVSVAG